MSNSSLICCTILSPNHSGKRTHAIDTITIHCMAGNLSVESCGALFARTSRQASSNYGIGSDGRIGLYVDEENRSWCTSSRANDQRAITIEVANNGGAPDWSVSDKAYEALIRLVTDICERNDIKRLVWATDKESRVGHLNGCNMTVHRDYANKSCPGNYLYDRHDEIAAEVNKRLGIQIETVEGTEEIVLKKGDVVTFTGKKHYSSANSKTPVSCKPGKATITLDPYLKGKHPYHLVAVKGGTSNVYGWVDAEDIYEAQPHASEDEVEEFKPYLVKVTASALNIRKGAGTNHRVVGCIRDKGTYTIVAEDNGWGKLKSGAGWISLAYTKRV